MQIIVRPARAEELQAAEELVVRSINDLTVRHGFGARRACDRRTFNNSP